MNSTNAMPKKVARVTCERCRSVLPVPLLIETADGKFACLNRGACEKRRARRPELTRPMGAPAETATPAPAAPEKKSRSRKKS